ncbi:sensor domain-containing protein [Mycolicibacterium neoaurum]|uniref:sensor domain-containing protein n=1 Tax=Mycolicibacterium neoaurum TaxID=1795 RepID=UPI00248C67AD|nr:sensor domain-containing protein [Mycolicibacterium neoaurum]WBP93613.1 sensor domain-containing protein [Mycolicibacterium neoaurum]WBS07406.1 sensor domain-containing protein [Mycolicibacterium neoaurum]
MGEQGGFGGDPFGGAPFGDPFAAPVATPPAGRDPYASPPHGGGTNPLAVLSVVFAFVFAPVGAILGHLGLAQIARTAQRGRALAMVGLVLSYVVIVCATAGLVLWMVRGGTPQTQVASSDPAPALPVPAAAPLPPAGPRVDRALLPEILIPLPELQALVADPDLALMFSTDALVEPRPEIGTYTDMSCIGSHLRGTAEGYRGNEPVAYVGTDIGNQVLGTVKTGQVMRQGAALYGDAAAAQKAFDDYLALWRRCVGQTTTWIRSDVPPWTFTYGEPTVLGPDLIMVRSIPPADARFIDLVHIVAVRANVLVDNTFTGRQLGDTPNRVTDTMLERVAARESG